MRTLQLTLEEAIEVCKALSNENRIKIMKILNGGPQQVNEIADKMEIPFSTAAVNINKLEEAGLISTELFPGRGTVKLNTNKYDRIIINLFQENVATNDQEIVIDMPIGDYINCEVCPTCGIVSETGFIGLQDEPRSFYESDRKKAQLLYFKQGFVEYRFPNRVPYGCKATEIGFSAEICSEAPYYKMDWPSDITVWINGIEIGFWTSPGDLGGERGLLTPEWWPITSTQYGLFKHWKVTNDGSFIDGIQISNLKIEDLKITEKPFIDFKMGVKKDSKNVGGLNLLGEKFGNYEQNLIMKLNYSN